MEISTLGWCAFHCNPGGLRGELRAGADPNQMDPDTGNTPLMWLCEMGDRHTKARRRMFRLLVAAGADLNQVNGEGLTAWHFAATSANKTFRRFVRSQYQRICGKVPTQHFRRADFP